MQPDGEGADGQLKATRLSLHILDEVRRRDGAGVTEIATHFDRSKSPIHSHLRTLSAEGYLVNENGHYTVGLQPLQLGGHARIKHDL